MKKLFLLLMIVPMIVFGQEKTSAIISVDKLYIGVENPITISSPGKNNENLTVSFKDGVTKCTNKSEGKYILIPSGKYNKRVADVSIYEGDKKLSTIEVKLFHVPPPVIELCGTEVLQDSYSHKEIFNLRICCKIKADISGIKTRVVSFDVSAVSANGTSKKVNAVQTFSSKEVRSLIKRTSQGDVIVIDNIKFDLNGSKSWSPVSISFKIK